ncbi:MAG TPA: sn-glycerol-1-phosphate dehydrogenase, partial [Spirochaetota bacterium]|nr:sn-glycerol-1-phosphate dehydrogenase [Spirochaetota bacterium]
MITNDRIDSAIMLGGKKCFCGSIHDRCVERIFCASGSVDGIVEVISPIIRKGKIHLVADVNTYVAAGENIEKILTQSGFVTKKTVFDDFSLVPDENAIVRLLTEIEDSADMVVAVGSGTINDLCRYISYRLRIPYCVVATAPSMDGYTSSVSPLIINKRKITFPAAAPYAVFADYGILSNAPERLIRAGFGDIIGKMTSMADWRLSHEKTGEHFCDTIAGIVVKSVDLCVVSADGISKRNEGAVENLTEALILSGLAMGLEGNSRPASGSEHHMAHYWEMDALSRGEDHPLHGESVGVAAVIISEIYHLSAGYHSYAAIVPPPDRIRS